MLPAPLFGRDSTYMYIKQRVVACGVTQGHAKGPWKAVLTKRGDVPPQIILFTSSIHLSSTLTPHALPHLSLISECLNPKYSVERLPADTQHQIKSFTVESKEFSLSLHKHESSGGDGLR